MEIEFYEIPPLKIEVEGSIMELLNQIKKMIWDRCSATYSFLTKEIVEDLSFINGIIWTAIRWTPIRNWEE